MSKKFIHSRFCEHPRVRCIYKDFILRCGICYDCGCRVGVLTKFGGILSDCFGFLIHKYCHHVMSKVFRDNISWFNIEDF